MLQFWFSYLHVWCCSLAHREYVFQLDKQISVIRQRAPPIWVNAKGVHKNICACRSETCAHKHTESTVSRQACIVNVSMIDVSDLFCKQAATWLPHHHHCCILWHNSNTHTRTHNSRFLWLFPVKFKLAGCNMIKLNSIMWPQKTSSSTGCVAFAEIPESILV